MIKSLPLSSLQSLLILVDQSINAGQSIDKFRILLASEIDTRIAAITGGNMPTVKKSNRRSPDNQTKCSECGGLAVIVPVNTDKKNRTGDRNTHAIQCQNRPATDQNWMPGMCGHTDYIMRGDK